MTTQGTSRIGIDFGGTKIEAIALDDAGEELFRRRVPTPRDYRDSLDAVAALVNEADERVGVKGTVGVGIPGAISARTGLVKNANSTFLIGHPMDRDLEAMLERPVKLMNDANCFALSEAVDGAGQGARVVFGVIIGTGVGGGVVVDGQLIDGAQKIAGEWGHNPMPWPRDGEWPGPACYCGRSGCVETFLSGPGFERDHREASGQAMASQDIVTAASCGEPAARATLDRYVERLGRALAVMVNILDPDIVVLGGSMSNLPDLAARVGRALKPHVFTDEATTVVRRNHHGDSGGVRGAAWLWPSTQVER